MSKSFTRPDWDEYFMLQAELLIDGLSNDNCTPRAQITSNIQEFNTIYNRIDSRLDGKMKELDLTLQSNTSSLVLLEILNTHNARSEFSINPHESDSHISHNTLSRLSITTYAIDIHVESENVSLDKRKSV